MLELQILHITDSISSICGIVFEWSRIFGMTKRDSPSHRYVDERVRARLKITYCLLFADFMGN